MDKSGRYLILSACRGTDPGGLEHVGITEGFTGKAARTRSFIAQHVSELEDKERAALLTNKGFKIIICVPLVAAGEVVGVMNLASGKLIKLDQEMIDLLEVIGNQISVAVNDKGRDYCEKIQKISEQIVTLVERINIYVQAKVAPLNIENLKIGEIFNELNEEFSSVLDSRHINWIEPKEDHLIRADRLSITRALRNLVDNALKYGGDNLSEITIGYREDEDFHIFSVGDDGVGVKKDQYEKIFQVYQREKTSKGIAGAGLGLAVVKEVATRHGGKVWAEPGAEKGTIFYVAISKKLQGK
jgi:K+-sensing histidine kinase KdpD